MTETTINIRVRADGLADVTISAADSGTLAELFREDATHTISVAHQIGEYVTGDGETTIYWDAAKAAETLYDAVGYDVFKQLQAEVDKFAPLDRLDEQTYLTDGEITELAEQVLSADLVALLDDVLILDDLEELV